MRGEAPMGKGRDIMAVTAADLENAIRGGGLELHLQEKVNLKSGMPAGFEALVRWPGSGSFPDEFVPLAERSGLATILGDWVTASAARIVADIMRDKEGAKLAAGVSGGLVAINVSGIELSDPSWHRRFLSTLADRDVPPRLVSIEVTETGIVNDEDVALGNLDAVRDTGVKVAMDDFGIGESGLAKLHSFLHHISAVKVDRKFISGLPIISGSGSGDVSGIDNGIDNGLRFEFLKWVIGIKRISRGSGDGLTVVVEGVENEWQADMLRQLGADVGQGWLWHRATTASSAVESASRRLRTALDGMKSRAA